MVLFLLYPLQAQGRVLDMVFTLQAPFGDWRQPWKDACEESSTTIVDHYYSKKPLNPTIAKNEILRLVDKEKELFHKHEDTNAEEIAHLINLFYPWEAEVRVDPTLDQIKAEINAGRPVIITVYGPDLHNPHLSKTIDYHVLVLSGIDDEHEEFIAQEVALRNGANWRYRYQTIMNALHDLSREWHTKARRETVVFTRPHIFTSGTTDGDNDGLNKAEEIQYGTSLWKSDTDNDGYSDSIEIANGYSPFVNESTLNNVAVKNASVPTTYLVKDKIKKPIANEYTFKAMGFSFSNIIVVSDRYLQTLPNGPMILHSPT